MVVGMTLGVANRCLISFMEPNIWWYILLVGAGVVPLVRLKRDMLVGIGISYVVLRVVMMTLWWVTLWALWWTSLRGNNISRWDLVGHRFEGHRFGKSGKGLKDRTQQVAITSKTKWPKPPRTHAG